MISEERVLVLTDLDGRATELRDQDLVTGLDRRGNALSISVESARADGQHLGLVQLLDGGFGEEDTAGGLGLSLDALDQNAVEKGGEGLDGLGGDGRLLFPRVSRLIVRACDMRRCQSVDDVPFWRLTEIDAVRKEDGLVVGISMVSCCSWRWNFPETQKPPVVETLGWGCERRPKLHPLPFRDSALPPLQYMIKNVSRCH